MPDSNDIVYTQYGINIEGLLRKLVELFGGTVENADSIYAFLLASWWIFSLLAYLVSAVLLFGIIYAKFREAELDEIEDEAIHALEERFREHTAEPASNARWNEAWKHGDSDNPNDWRLAIIEADIMLEELLQNLGYPGMTIGDKLKQASPQFFKTLDDAWKAHRVRNEIAHRGSDFILTKRLARETLEQYRRVFEEFKVI